LISTASDAMASITNNNVVETNESKGPEGNDSRTGYYNDWEKKAKKLADEVARQEEIEKEIEDKKVGLKDAPKSEKEAKDKAKFKALKEAKKAVGRSKANGRKSEI